MASPYALFFYAKRQRVRLPRRQRPDLLLLICLWLLLAGCVSGAGSAPAAPELLPAAQESLPLKNGLTPPLGPSLGEHSPAQPNRIALPAIGVETDVVKVGWDAVTTANGQTASRWQVADFAAGWHKNSAVPGQPGNVVLSGHNNIRGAVFRKLYQLQPGDTATVWAGGHAFDYRVEEVMILEEEGAPLEQRRENARWIQPFDDERLTLVSCWPESSNSHRVIVVAKPVGKVSREP